MNPETKNPLSAALLASGSGATSANIFTVEAEVNENGGEFAGLDRMAARQAVKAALEAGGHLDHIEERTHAVGHCYRCSAVVEPYLLKIGFILRTTQGRRTTPEAIPS